MTTLWEVNRDIYENDLREEGREVGRAEGIKEGKLEIIFAMYQSGMSITQIASIIKMDVKELEKIITDSNQTDECIVANDEDVLEISNKLLAQNKEAYEVLAK